MRPREHRGGLVLVKQLQALEQPEDGSAARLSRLRGVVRGWVYLRRCAYRPPSGNCANHCRHGTASSAVPAVMRALRQNSLRRNTMMTAPVPVPVCSALHGRGARMGHMGHTAPAALGVYKPRRPQASPLFRLVQDHLHRLQTVYDERFAREYGPWRPVVGEVTDKFLACGILEHGFARIRCDACAHEYLLAFSCKGRYFCPSCHAKRLAIWAQWLDTTLLAPVPHRQVVLTIPKRLRAYCLYRRRLLGEIARVAARTVTAAIRTLTGEHDLAVGIVACLQTHGSRANWHPHLHLLVTDGGFRPDGTFVSWPAHDTARLTEAFRRAVLRLFVRLELFDEDQAAGMLTWPHSGFHVHTAVWVPEDDRAFATRLARYCARNPVALERLTYDRAAKTVTYRSDKSEGPTAGTETADPLEFLARVLVHIPDKGQVTTRYYGWYANRPRGMRRQAEPAARRCPRADGGRAEAGAHRGDAPVGGVAAADLRGRPAGVPALRRPDADRGVHHAGGGDRPDPGAPAHARAAAGAQLGAQRARSPPATGAFVARDTLAHGADRPRAPRPSTRPEGPACRPARPGSPVGAVRRARSSGIESPPGDDDPSRGRPAEARRGQAGDRRATDPSWTAHGLVARREVSRHTCTTAIQIPILKIALRRPS